MKYYIFLLFLYKGDLLFSIMELSLGMHFCRVLLSRTEFFYSDLTEREALRPVFHVADVLSVCSFLNRLWNHVIVILSF